MGNYYFGGMHMNAIKASALLVTCGGKFITYNFCGSGILGIEVWKCSTSKCMPTVQIARKENMLKAISI